MIENADALVDSLRSILGKVPENSKKLEELGESNEVLQKRIAELEANQQMIAEFIEGVVNAIIGGGSLGD